MKAARAAALLTFLLAPAFGPRAHAQQPVEANQGPQQTQAQNSRWHYGAFVDLGYLLDFNHPANHLFRSRGTTPLVDEANLNMAAIYVRKDASEQSRWGMELTLQAGEDSRVFGFSATAPNFPGAVPGAGR